MGEIILNLKPRSKVISMKISEYDLAMLDRHILRVLPGLTRSEVLRGIAKALAYSLARVSDEEEIQAIILLVKTDNREIKVTMEVGEHDRISVNRDSTGDSNPIQD